METSGGEGKRNLREKAKKEVVEEEEDGDEEEEYGLGLGFGDDDKKKRAVASGRKASAGGGVSSPCCQAERCTADLNEAKRYHRRHKVCEHHSKAPVVLVSGFQQRFCQQCSRFHELAEFDETKRSCRRRLAGHNERRRKSSSESQEGSTQKGVDQLRENLCRQADERGKIQITVPGNSTYKHFQIR